MAFTRFEKDVANISKLSDRPNQNDGLSSVQLKGRFDKGSVDIRDFINEHIDELEFTEDGNSGADSIGVTPITEGGSDKLQTILEEMQGEKESLDLSAIHKTGDETIDGVKTFNSSPQVPVPTTNTDAANMKYVNEEISAADATAVHKTGNETINGVKTFTSNPIVPEPLTNSQVATKKYADDIANARYTKTNLQTSGQATIHWGNLTNVPSLGDSHWKPPVASKATLPTTGNAFNDVRVVLDDGDGKQAVYLCIATSGSIDIQWSKIGDVDWQSEEATRIAQENERKFNEGSLDPKSGRLGAEADRIAAENARLAAEGDENSGRIKAENDRQAAEIIREQNELARQAHINDKNNPHEVTAEQINAVPNTRTVNSKPLDDDIALDAFDVGAVDIDDIADNLETDDSTKVLSAKQGKNLKDGLDTLGQVVDTHLSSSMPHEFIDTRDNKKYHYGLQISPEGAMQMIYEEVI